MGKELIGVASSPRILRPSWLGFYPDFSSTAAAMPALSARQNASKGPVEDQPSIEETRRVDGVAGVKGDLAPATVDALVDGMKEVAITALPRADTHTAAEQSARVQVDETAAPIPHGGESDGSNGKAQARAGTGKGDEAVDRVLSLAPPLSPHSPSFNTSSTPSLSSIPPIPSSVEPSTSLPSANLGRASARPSIPSSSSTSDPNTDTDTDLHPNPHLPTFNRADFLRQRLYARTHEWSEEKRVRVRVGTYNVNDRLPPERTVELEGWARGGGGESAGGGGEDVLAFGMQEVGKSYISPFSAMGSRRASEANGSGDEEWS